MTRRVLAIVGNALVLILGGAALTSLCVMYVRGDGRLYREPDAAIALGALGLAACIAGAAGLSILFAKQPATRTMTITRSVARAATLLSVVTNVALGMPHASDAQKATRGMQIALYRLASAESASYAKYHRYSADTAFPGALLSFSGGLDFRKQLRVERADDNGWAATARSYSITRMCGASGTPDGRTFVFCTPECRYTATTRSC